MRGNITKKLKQHAWLTRAVVLTVLFGLFTLTMGWLLRRDIDQASLVSTSENEAARASSKVVLQKRQQAEAEAARKKAEQEKQPAATNPPVATTDWHRDPARLDVLVNKKHPLVPLNYAPQVVSVDCAGQGGIVVQVQVQTDLAALCQAAAAAGVPLAASSAYRSYTTQVSTYNYWVSRDGQAAADTYSARAGYSEHQTGYAIDFRVPGGATLDAFSGTPQQLWLAANAPRFGFIQRYTTANTAETGYMAESWHYRYVGRDIALAYATSGASSLESFWGLPGGGY